MIIRIVKRLALSALLCASVMILAGCGDDVSMTNEQSDLVAEYIAGTMLKYSYDNEWKYYKLNSKLNQYVSNNTTTDTTQTTAASDSQNGQTIATADNSGSGTDDSTNQSAGVSEESITLSKTLPGLLNLDGTVIRYSQTVVGSSYPTGDYVLSVPAVTGKKVVAVEFTITNNTSSPIVANTASSGVIMKLAIGKTKVTSYGTLLNNDMLNMSDVTIGVGETYTAAVIFQVDESVADNTSGAVLSVIQNGSEVASLTL